MPFKARSFILLLVVATLGLLFMAAKPKQEPPPNPYEAFTQFSHLETRCAAGDTVCFSRLVVVTTDARKHTITVTPESGNPYTVVLSGDGSSGKIGATKVEVSRTDNSIILKAPNYTTAIMQLNLTGSSGGLSRSSGSVVMSKKIYVSAYQTTLYHSSGGLSRLCEVGRTI